MISVTLKDSIMRDVRQTSALVSDLDGTLSKGRWIQSGYGYPLLQREFKSGHLIKSAGLVLDVARIKLLLRKNKGKDTAEADGLKLFYDILIKHKEGYEGDLVWHARKYFESNAISPTVEIANAYVSGPKFIATQSGSTGAQAAVEHFSFGGAVSNIDRFGYGRKGNRLVGINMIIRTGEDKERLIGERLLSGFHIRLSECAVMGDGLADIPLLMAARVRIASPEAKPEVLALPGIIPLSELLKGQ